MTSALAAALRELEHSRHVLEKELHAHPAFTLWLQLGSEIEPPDAVERRQVLLASLEDLAVFRAWRSVVSSHEILKGQAAPHPASATQSRTVDTGKQWPRPTGPDLPERPERPSHTGQQSFASPRRFSPPPGPPQALTAIRGLSPTVAQQLQAMGVQRYAQIASWTADDVQHVRAALRLGREISRRNWIEQAALLDAKGDRRSRRDAGAIANPAVAKSLAPLSQSPGHDLVPAVRPALGHAPSAPRAEPSPPAVAVTDAETMRAAARSAAMATMHARTRPAEPRDALASTRETDTPIPVEPEAGPQDAVIHDADSEPKPAAPPIGWIFASGRIAFGDVRPVRRPLPRVETGTPSPAVRSLPLAETSQAPETEPKTETEPGSQAEPEPQSTPDPGPDSPRSGMLQPDAQPMASALQSSSFCELRHIAGIDAAIAQSIAQAAVTDFATIAAWRRGDVDRMAARLGVDRRRICREGWIEQAALLATGRASAFSGRFTRGDLDALCAAPPSPPDVRPLPVVSPAAAPDTSPDIALVTPTTVATHAAELPPVAHDAPPPDVPRITVDPPSIASATRDIEPDEPWPAPEAVEAVEAVVSVVRTTSPSPLSPSAGIGVMPRVAQAFNPPPPEQGDVERWRTQGPSEPWNPPPVVEEASVEIIRRGDEMTVVQGHSHLAPTPVRPPQSIRPMPRHTDTQPVWIAEREAEAGSVVRRFLKALKRDG